MKAKHFIYPAAILIIAATSSCANKSNNDTSSTDSTKLSSVETKSANTKYKPAFEGQTRIAGIKTT